MEHIKDVADGQELRRTSWSFTESIKQNFQMSYGRRLKIVKTESLFL